MSGFVDQRRARSGPPAGGVVTAAAGELEDRGFVLLHAPREEPWGQTVARLLTAEGLIIGISFAPSLHEHHGGE